MTSFPRARLSSLSKNRLSRDAQSVLAEIDEIVVYELPMNIEFRGITRREGLLLRGQDGWGECAPFWDYDLDESARWLSSALEDATWPTAPPRRNRIPVNVTIPTCDPDEAERRILSQPGCSTAKVKVAGVGQQVEKDIERVATVAALLARTYGSDARVRVDANAAWSVPEAASVLDVLNTAAQPVGGLEYAEQPVVTTAELAELHATTDIPLAADESIRRALDPLEVRQRNAADIAVLKVAPLGGVRRAQWLAHALGLPPVVSSALDSSIGIAAGVLLAASLDDLDYACGLNTATMFAADVLRDPLIADGGAIDVEQAQAAKMAELNPVAAKVDRDVLDRWSGRLSGMAAALQAAERQEAR